MNLVKNKKVYKILGIPFFLKEEGVLCNDDKENFIKHYIISITDYEDTHLQIKIFGIKIKFPKWRYYKLKKQNSFYEYKSKNLDITKIPKAEGFLRDIQLANLYLLKELDYVCRKNNISYWLDGGTLLGAVRHKGFIPWDDDIDVGMLSCDYDRIIKAFKQSSRDKNIYAQYCRNDKNKDICIIKICHKKCKHIFVDIFPFYFYPHELDSENQCKKTKDIKKIRKKNEKLLKSLKTKKELINMHKEIMQQIIPQYVENGTNLVWGIQYNHQWKNWFTNYDVVYPLKTIKFEGYEFYSMNKPEEFLSRVYGNYMNYPSKITFGHSAYKNMNQKEKLVIKCLSKEIRKSRQNFDRA